MSYNEWVTSGERAKRAFVLPRTLNRTKPNGICPATLSVRATRINKFPLTPSPSSPYSICFHSL